MWEWDVGAVGVELQAEEGVDEDENQADELGRRGAAWSVRQQNMGGGTEEEGSDERAGGWKGGRVVRVTVTGGHGGHCGR
jgi:hypothetical protein